MRAAVAAAVVTVLSLLGCASDLPRTAASLDAVAASDPLPQRITITASVTVVPPSMYKREIRAGSQWRLVGRVAQGAVYRPIETVFTVESAHVHEAYLVIDGRTLVGAYLPVERAFVRVEPVKDLPITIN